MRTTQQKSIRPAMTHAPAPNRRSRSIFLGLLAALLLAPSARAGILYDFSFNFEQYSASGQLVMSDAVGVGDEFDFNDVESFDLDFFVSGSPVGSSSYPPWPSFDFVVGTRNASSLAMMDLSVSDFDNWFGCRGGDCLFEGEVVFPTAPMDLVLGSPQAARDSFVFIELPEPSAALMLVIGAGLLALLRRRSRRSG